AWRARAHPGRPDPPRLPHARELHRTCEPLFVAGRGHGGARTQSWLQRGEHRVAADGALPVELFLSWRTVRRPRRPAGADDPRRVRELEVREGVGNREIGGIAVIGGSGRWKGIRNMTRQKIGVGLVMLTYLLLLYMSVSARAYARAHPHLDAAILAQFAAPWPVALGCALAVAGIMLAVVPLRRGEPWAMWTQLAMLAILFATRLSTDPRCLVVLDPHQHGCHTFMIAVVAGVVGLGLARGFRG